MERRLLLEGDDIDELLERVRTEHGQHARIVGAEQRLVGGLGGFFAKRRYEVAVALDDGTEVSDAAAVTVETDDTFDRTVTTAATVLPARPSAPQPTPQSTQQAAQPPARRPITSLEDLMDAAGQQDGGLATAPGNPSQQVAPRYDSTPSEYPAPTCTTPSPAYTTPAAPAEPEPLAVTPPASPSLQSLVFDELVRDFASRAGSASHVDDPARLPSMWATEPVAHPARPQLGYPQQALPVHLQPELVASPGTFTVAAEPAAAEQPFAAALPRVLTEAFASPSQQAPVQAAQPVPARPSAVVAGQGQQLPRGAATASPVPASLLALGLPAPEADSRIALLDLLAGVAVSAPSQLDGVHVVVGDPAAVHSLATAWLRLCAADETSLLVVAAPAPGAGDALDALRSGLTDALAYDGGALVLVEAGPSRAQARRAARQVAAVLAAVAALSPASTSTVTAVLDARWDVETTRGWLDALGSEGHAITDLGAHGVSESAVPLRLLGHGLVVAWLDAAPATLGAWAGPCLDRLR